MHRTALPLMDVWGGGSMQETRVAGDATLFHPRFYFIQVPNRTSSGQVKAFWELATLLQLIDRRVAERDDLTQLRPSDVALKW